MPVEYQRNYDYYLLLTTYYLILKYYGAETLGKIRAGK